ncbi:MAG TPA: FGGY-family carbohydrate kinase [Actinocrinis sp.]|nr:FGGY-family carbohydrate kinase [Actinocrinis sp.]
MTPPPPVPSPAPARYVLGVDLGTGGPKVAVADTAGTLLGHEAERVAVRFLPGGGAEQDPDDWWTAVAAATARLLARLDLPAERIAALCFSAQWGGTVPVDADGVATHPAVIWMDSRGAAHSRRIAGGGITVPGTGYNARKLRRWLSRTGGAPTLTGKDPVGQSHFLRTERPEAYAAARWLLDVPEYLTMRATGRAVAAYDTAVLRWCTDNRDASRVRWDAPLIRRCGLDPAKLPDLVAPGTIVGTLTPKAAADLGLHPGVQVVAGTGDTTAAAIGAGAVREYDAHLYVGTSAWLSCHVPYKKTDITRNIASMPSVVPGLYWVATVQDVAGKAVDWLLDTVLHETGPDRPRPADALDRLGALAATAPPGCHGVLFLPWLNGERTPVDDPAVRGGWINVSLTTGRADLARSVFEGVALNARWMLEAVDRFAAKGHGRGPARLGALRFIGGGANSALWCQAMADILDREIRQVADPVSANVHGAALLAAVALGELGWEQIPGTVSVAAVYRPDPANREVYDESYRAYREAYRRLRPFYARLRGPGR